MTAGQDDPLSKTHIIPCGCLLEGYDRFVKKHHGHRELFVRSLLPAQASVILCDHMLSMR